MTAPVPPTHLTTIPADAPTGAPVLCLHGMFAGAWVYDDLLPLIAARGYPAHALSFRGHPPNAPVPQLGRLSIADYCEDASAAARALDRPIVIGHSLGGLVALMLAGHNLARAVVLVSSAPPRGITVLSGQLLARMTRYLPALLFSRAFKPKNADLDALVLNRVAEEDRAALRDKLTPDSGRVARQAALGVFKVPSRAVRAPVLVMAGKEDRFIPPSVARRLALRYDAPLHLLPGHGHFLFAEPGWHAAAATIIDWMDALPRAIRDPQADLRPRPSWPGATAR